MRRSAIPFYPPPTTWTIRDWRRCLEAINIHGPRVGHAEALPGESSPADGGGLRDLFPGTPFAARSAMDSLLKALATATAALAMAMPTMGAKRAEFGKIQPSADARVIADWSVDSGDHQGRPFGIIDKRGARLYVFDSRGRLVGNAPVLLGSALGDHTVPGIGEREFSQIKPHERTTPAGRFVTEPGRNLRGEDIVWIDYEAAVSMHPVLTTNPKERRLHRLATPNVNDNRVSFGCVNVPTRFFQQVVVPNLRKPHTVVYVLPDVKPLRQVFTYYEVREGSRRTGTAAPVQDLAQQGVRP